MASANGNNVRRMLAVFDLDGTLLHTMPDITHAVNGALAAQGFPPYGEAEVALMVGSGVSVLAQKALAGRGDTARFLEDYRRLYAENLTRETRPYAGIAEAVKEIRKTGAKTAVLSNKPHGDTARLISELFPAGLFDAAWGQRDGVPKKPDPHMLHFAEEYFDTARGDCVLIGDSDIDAQTAKNAGWRFAGVAWGYRSAEVLKAAGAEAIAVRPEELPGLVLKFKLPD